MEVREGRPLLLSYFRHLAFWDNQKGIKRLVHFAVQLESFTFESLVYCLVGFCSVRSKMAQTRSRNTTCASVS